MSDYVAARAQIIAERLAGARCWHQGPKAFAGRGTSSKWWDLNPADVEEAIIRLRELASAIEARSDAAPQSDAAEGESAVAKPDAPKAHP